MAPRERLRVALDANPLVHQRTGIGQFTAQLLALLATRGDIDACAYAITRRGRRTVARQVPLGVRAATSPLPARVAHTLWSSLSWPRVEHWTGEIDVVHATNFVAPPARAPVVVTVHDLAFVTSPELCQRETREYEPQLRRAISRGATVHAVSDYVAGAARTHFGLDGDRVVRVYEGAAPMLGAGTAGTGHALAGGDEYVLALATVEPRKNLPRLVRAFDAIAADHPRLLLVVAGADGWDVDAFDAAVRAAHASARVRRLGYVSDAERADLLAGARALAYPSLDEGFGHPPLEAMAARVPVVASCAGALPEILGDAALLVDPRDEAALADALQRILVDTELRRQLVERGEARALAFPWGRAVDEMVDLYRRVAA